MIGAVIKGAALAVLVSMTMPVWAEDGVSEGHEGVEASAFAHQCNGFQWGQCASKCRSATLAIDGGRGCGSMCSRVAGQCAAKLTGKIKAADVEALKRLGWTMETWKRDQDQKESSKAWGRVSCEMRNWEQSPTARNSTCSSWD